MGKPIIEIVTNLDGTSNRNLVRYRYIPNPNRDQEVNLSALGSVTVQCDGIVYGNCKGTALYKAEPTRVDITFPSGTTLVGQSIQSLAGRGITASVSSGTYAQSNHNWSFPAGASNCFGGFNIAADQSSSSMTPLVTTNPTFHFYIKGKNKTPPTINVQCSFTLTMTPSGETKDVVIQSENLKGNIPASQWTITSGSVGFTQSYASFGLLGSTNHPHGQAWDGYVVMPSNFSGETGEYAMCQVKSSLYTYTTTSAPPYDVCNVASGRFRLRSHRHVRCGTG